MARKPRWAKNRDYQLHLIDRYPRRIVTSLTHEPWAEFIAAAAQLWVVPEPKQTITRTARPVPRRRTWRHR
jgi:hypothetical protein